MADVQLDPATLLFAAGAGLLSFVSPCVLPLLPAYLSYMTGLSAEQLIARQDAATRVRVLGHSLAFVAGLAIVFTLFGASATFVGRVLLQNLELLTKLAGLLVILFGLHMTGLVRIPLLYREARFDPSGVSCKPFASSERASRTMRPAIFAPAASAVGVL